MSNTANTSAQTEQALIITGIPAYAANLQETIRLFDPDTANYSGIALPVETVKMLMRTGHKAFMRIF